MRLLKRSCIGAGAMAVLAALALSVPRAAHALAAALVQVSNTVAAPAITQGVPNLASQIVYLGNSIGLTVLGGPFFSLSPQASAVSFSYVTPASHSLVITSIQFAPYALDAGNTLRLRLVNASTGGEYGDWTVPCDSITNLQFPTGIVVGPGVEPSLVAVSGSSTALFQVDIQGYLTAN